MTIINKRFVAGAQCPQCKVVDTIMLYKEDDIEVMECADCHYLIKQTDDNDKELQPQESSNEIIGIFKQ